MAREFSVSVPTLYYWAKDRRPEVNEDGTPMDPFTALRSENERLRAENEKLQRQKQILRRALGIMSEMPKSPSGEMAAG